MKKNWFALFALLCCGPWVWAQKSSYKIEVEVRNAVAKELFLAYHFGAKQYMRDTATAISPGKYVFEGNAPLEPGIYLVAMPPTNRYFELLIPKDAQSFSVATDTTQYGKGLQIKNSEENSRFYEYLNFLAEKREEAQKLQPQMQDASKTPEQLIEIEAQLEAVNESVRQRQKAIADANDGTLFCALIRANEEPPVPEAPEGLSGDEAQRYKLYKYRDAYFNYIDFADARLLRTPIFERKILDYLERLTVKHPDSINVAVDRILALAKAGKNEEVYKFCVSRLLNEYAQSKIMGMDAVYVHIALNYYSKEKTPWIDDEQLSKIIDNASRLKPLLIGKKAPDLNLPILDGNGKRITLHGLKAKYTVLYFWDPDCGNCNKTSDQLVAMYDTYKALGVEVFGVCNKDQKELHKCGEKVRDKGIKWINTADPTGEGQAHAKYFVKANPLIILLDEEKIIRFKRIDPEQLKDILDRELGLKKEE